MVLSSSFVTPEWFCEGSTVLKTSGFPIKNFGNDGGGGRHPEWFYQGSTVLKIKGKSKNVDSR
jgi:hypothetical protein